MKKYTFKIKHKDNFDFSQGLIQVEYLSYKLRSLKDLSLSLEA